MKEFFSYNLSTPLQKRKSDKRVEWSSDTIDNEHLSRRSSKCYCIYEKPHAFGESSSESEKEDEENCDAILCIWGHHRGRSRALSNSASSTSSSKPPDPRQPLPSPIKG
uniref:E3 ubiquitin-protein ligase PPP1R11 n=1 Tax=Marmota marmota marmota TaxID=9994 RepID=A0A8C6A039_MARMA